MKELKSMTPAQLAKELATLREQVRDLRFKTYSKEVKNNHQLIALRKDIARILTILNSK